MKKVIVTTTINKPTEATLKFCDRKDWEFIVVGDIKTPHREYEKLNCIYLRPDEQAKKYKKLSKLIGWNTIQRRNIGFIEAYNMGANIIASVDDDNIPYDSWGENVYVGEEIECDMFEPQLSVFDPLAVTNLNNLWHRGFPIEYIEKRNLVSYEGKVKRMVRVQADLWDGDPDIDAIARLSKNVIGKIAVIEPYCSNRISPFNSQNTFFAREVIPYYAVLPFVGRMDDIWGGYILQNKFPNSLIYNRASVYQERNLQDTITNLEKEIIGYRHTLDFINSGADLNQKYIPQETRDFYKHYKSLFKEKTT
ncbi:MAG TPA: hypothetical protein ENH82_03385 [bacterium]|nr:hypothetical protein [bacterium]